MDSTYVKLICISTYLAINLSLSYGYQVLSADDDGSETAKTSRITNTEGERVFEEEIIFELNKTSVVHSTSNVTGALRQMTWNSGQIDYKDLKILNEHKNVESLAFIRTKGTIILTGDILQNLTDLKELVIHNNNKVTIEETSLGNLINLQVLSVDHQNWSSLTSKTFENCTKLQYLLLNNGVLGEIHPGAFQHLKNLIFVTLSKMSLKYLRTNTFKDLPLLYMINLSGNELSQISGAEFTNLPKLRVLNLEQNYLHSIKAEDIVRNLPNLKFLKISHNKFPCKEILEIGAFLSKFNVSSFDQRDQDRCEFSPGRIQIFSA